MSSISFIIFSELLCSPKSKKALVNGKAVFKNVDVIARMSNMTAVKQVVSRGLGVSIVSEQIVKETALVENIRYFKIRGLDKTRCFYLAYNKGICLSPIAERFLEYVRETVALESDSCRNKK